MRNYTITEPEDVTNKTYVDSAIALATSTMGNGDSFWDGDLGGDIWSLNSGSVGIGTDHPGSKLEIRDSLDLGDNSIFSIYNNDVLRTTMYGTGKQIFYMSDDVDEAGRVDISTPGGHPGFAIYTGATYNQNRFNLYNNGTLFHLGYLADGFTDGGINIMQGNMVGIATATPGTTLDIYGLAKMRNYVITQPEDITNKSYVDSAIATATGTITSLWGGTIGGDIWSLNSGKIGIGTTSPAQALDVWGKFALNGTTLAYLPDQTNFTGTVYFGNGGASLTHGSDTDGFYNTYLGLGAGLANTGGESNSGIGNNSLLINTDGSFNTALGESTLLDNVAGSNNTAIGYQSLMSNSSGGMNVSVGYGASASNSLGSWNTALGVYAMSHGAASGYNVAVGATAGRYIQGANNVAVGVGAAQGNVGGALIYDNVAIGNNAGFILEEGGDSNVLIGINAGDLLTTGARNIIIGANASTTSATINDWLNIGNTIYGDLSTKNVSVGTSSTPARFNVKSGGTASTSDAFKITNSNNLEMFRLRDDGRVGIALGNTITNPQKALDVSGDINLTPVSAPLASFTLTGTTGGSLDDGAVYWYSIAYGTADGETEAAYKGASYRKSVDLDPGQTSVQLTNIPVSSDPRVTKRKIYRSAGDEAETASQYLVTTINNNTATSYTDTTADGSRTLTDTTYRKDNTTVKGIYFDNTAFAKLGEWNSSYGFGALAVLTTGRENFAFGRAAAAAVNSGSNNIAIGSSALPSVTSGNSNIGIGYTSLYINQTGSYNVAIGNGAVRLASGNVTGNTGVGVDASFNITNANNYNTSLGYFAGAYFQGSYNLFLGAETGRLAGATAVGSYNTFIGYDVGDNAAAGADNNILIGKQIDLQATTSDNQLSIGNLIFGTALDGTGTTISSGNIGIGTTTPGGKLDIYGLAKMRNATITQDEDLITKGYLDSALTDYFYGFSGITRDYVPAFNSDGTLRNSLIQDDNNTVAVGSAPDGVNLLFVNGKFKATDYYSSPGNIGVTANYQLADSEAKPCQLTVENGLIVGGTCPVK